MLKRLTIIYFHKEERGTGLFFEVIISNAPNRFIIKEQACLHMMKNKLEALANAVATPTKEETIKEKNCRE